MSPARQRLAAAIERYAAAARAVDAITTAQSATGRLDAFLATERAERAVADAKAAEPGRRTAELLGHATAGPSLAEAERALAAAKATHAAAIDDAALLERAAAEAARAANLARIDRETAILGVLQESAELAQLFASLAQARNRVGEIEAALRSAIGPSRLTPYQTSMIEVVADRRYDGALAQRWRVALAALATDATAPLPGDDDAPAAA